MRPRWVRYDDVGYDEYMLVDADVGMSLGMVVKREGGWFVADPWMPDRTFTELGDAMDAVERPLRRDAPPARVPGGARPDP